MTFRSHIQNLNQIDKLLRKLGYQISRFGEPDKLGFEVDFQPIIYVRGENVIEVYQAFRKTFPFSEPTLKRPEPITIKYKGDSAGLKELEDSSIKQ